MKSSVLFLVLAITAAGLLAGCGGGSSGSSSPSSPTGVTGVATPKGVSVVTAN